MVRFIYKYGEGEREREREEESIDQNILMNRLLYYHVHKIHRSS